MPESHDSQPSDSDPRRLLGRIISGRYRIDELIGEGGMGAVYRAEHVHMRKRLAIKVLHPAMLGMSEIVERFEREAIAGAHIEHPNVAAATDFGKLDDGSHFLVLELLEGEDLRSVIGRGPIAADRALRITRQIALALRAAHQLGVVHRDLKPENVMLQRREREPDFVKVLDFGIAKVPVASLGGDSVGGASTKALTKLGMVYGTPEYMAPEQALGEEIDGRADLYALGVILYEMLTGRRPFEADGRSALLAQVMAKPVPPMSERAPGVVVPAALEAVAVRLLDKSAQGRYQDAVEVVDALDQVAFELGVVVTAMRGVSSPDRSGAHRPELPSERETQSGLRSFRSEAATIAGRAGSRAALPEASAPSAPARRSPFPNGALLAGLGTIAIIGAVAIALSLRTPGAIAALERAAAGADAATPAASASAGGPSEEADETPPPPTTASPEELQAARVKGITGLGALAQTYPNDPVVLKALMLAHAADKTGYAPAVAVAKRLFEVDPRAIHDPDAKQVLFMAANGPIDGATAALDVMGSAMASHGPDLLFELLTAPSVGKFPKDRAATLLATPDVQSRATPAPVIANDLRAVSGCKRKALLPRAKEAGDGRSLPYLKPLLATTGCGFFSRFDCFSCLGNRADVREAVAAIEKRIEKR
jgi:serine/threonine-protein kinase